VHAGLEADGSADCEEQIASLVDRDARMAQPAALFGREGVLHTPPQLASRGTTVISGHHGKVLLKTHRLVLDSCCGDERNALTAMILPDMLLVQHDGKVDARDFASVFSERVKHKRGATSNAGAPSTTKQKHHFFSSPGRLSSDDTLPPLGVDDVSRTGSVSSAASRCSMPQGDSSPLED